MKETCSPPRWKVLLAYGTIYVVWGSTFLTIKIGVATFPPLLFAAMRFLLAGFLLFSWMMLRGHKVPTPREWRSIALLSALIFLVDYGLLFWAEQRVASGLAAVLMATVPLSTALFEIYIVRKRRFTSRLTAALLTGIGGVTVLTLRSMRLGGMPVNRGAATAILCAAIAWSLASVLSGCLPLPSSKSVNAGAQMLLGGLFLLCGAWIAGEIHASVWSHTTRAAWMSLFYLVIAGSLIGFTAYVWLITHESPTRVGTYAFVNPLVAVFLGSAFGKEPIGLRSLVGCGLVLAGVLGLIEGPQFHTKAFQKIRKLGWRS